MFSNVFHVLQHIYLAEKLGLMPVVDMRQYMTYYNEAEEIDGTRNAWEYYFEQPSGFSLDEVYQSSRVFIMYGKPRDDLYSEFVFDFSLTNPTFKKYFKPRAHILAHVEKFAREHFYKAYIDY